MVNGKSYQELRSTLITNNATKCILCMENITSVYNRQASLHINLCVYVYTCMCVRVSTLPSMAKTYTRVVLCVARRAARTGWRGPIGVVLAPVAILSPSSLSLDV